MAKRDVNVVIRGHDRASKTFQQVGGSAERLGRTIRNVGLSLGVYFSGRMIANFGTSAVQSFLQMEEGLAKVNTMLSDGNEKHLPKYRQQMESFAVKYGQSVNVLTDGMYSLLSAQIDAADAAGVLEVTSRAAVGGQTDVATASKATVRILKSYNLEASQAADVSDLLFKIVEKGIVSYEELAETIGTVAPSARAAGLTMDELAASVATALSTEEPARAMTALRSAIFQSAEAGQNFMEFVKEFEGKNLQQIIEAGVPKKSAAGIVVLSGNMKLLNDNLDAMRNRSGAAQAAFDKMSETGAFRARQMRERWEGVKREVGEALLPSLEKLAEVLEKNMPKIEDFFRTIAEGVGGMIEWAVENREAIITTVEWGVKILLLSKAISVATPLIRGATSAMSAFSAAKGAGGVVSVLGKFGALLSPAGLIVGGLAAVGIGALAVKKRIDDINESRSRLQSGWEEFQEKMKAAEIKGPATIEERKESLEKRKVLLKEEAERIGEEGGETGFQFGGESLRAKEREHRQKVLQLREEEKKLIQEAKELQESMFFEEARRRTLEAEAAAAEVKKKNAAAEAAAEEQTKFNQMSFEDIQKAADEARKKQLQKDLRAAEEKRDFIKILSLREQIAAGDLSAMEKAFRSAVGPGAIPSILADPTRKAATQEARFLENTQTRGQKQLKETQRTNQILERVLGTMIRNKPQEISAFDI